MFLDDSMTILMAFQEPSLDIIGLTTIFGNISTEGATRNALLLCEKAGHPEVPVAEGSPEPLKGGKPRVADFVHGSDGIGNLFLPAPSAKKVEESAAEFLVNQVSQFPGEVTVLALGPLTNVALAIKSDSCFASNVRKIVVLGGAFFAAGNVNPAAEANIHGDPEAADIVFTSGADIAVVGINITTQVCLTDEDLLELKYSKGKHTQFLSDMCKFYRDWHAKSDGFHGIFLHDPVSFTALVHPEYFTWNSENPWSGYKPISVAWTVDVPKVIGYIKKRLMAL
ncbi:hypothetical protein PR202_gb02376 [Eleusine coracana subsp. coracana]|uniref:Inosine/uridine-preferring nucleoside hydrolase domain-containing protein n=1 Tax=Eleusine coracana subsp. coracana TaxID=191504 RepID=A0AAV5DYU1_ELECO|nr:hypothetical protein PR202_gb02376 [Eleusine coracana subsp. coracana]